MDRVRETAVKSKSAADWVQFDANYRLGTHPLASCAAIVRELRVNAWQTWVIFRAAYAASTRETKLGRIWSVLMPLVPIGAFVCISLLRVFPASPAISGGAYLGIGLALWLLFQGIILSPMEATRKYRHIARGAELPLICLFAASCGRALFDTTVRLLLLVPMLLALGHLRSGWAGLAWTVLLLAVALTFFFALGVLLALLNSLLGDVRNVIDVAFRYLVFVSFAIFPLPMELPAAIWLYHLNPLAVFIDNIRSALVLGELASPTALATWSLVSIAVVIAIMHAHHVLERRLVSAL